MSEVITADDRPAWLAARRTGIGASEVSGVLGLSSWSSPWSIWADKVGLLPLDDELPEDDPREFGRRAEAMLGPWFTDTTGLHIRAEQELATHPEHGWMLATPDGEVYDFAVPLEDVGESYLTPLGGLEIKTDFGRPWDEIPAHYQTQGQWQMAVKGWERVWFAVLHGRRFRTYELERDDADIEFMIDRVGTFWRDHVETGDPPPLDGHDATLRALAAIYPTHIDKSTIDLDYVAGAVELLAEAKRARKAAEANEKGATAVIRWAMGANYEGTLDGRRAVTLGTQTRKTTCQHCGTVDESDPFRVLRPTKELT